MSWVLCLAHWEVGKQLGTLIGCPRAVVQATDTTRVLQVHGANLSAPSLPQAPTHLWHTVTHSLRIELGVYPHTTAAGHTDHGCRVMRAWVQVL